MPGRMLTASSYRALEHFFTDLSDVHPCPAVAPEQPPGRLLEEP
jgi:hypothetical protein